jgi:hypothetical protein
MPGKKLAQGHAAPKASRPFMPDYGVLDAQSGQGLLLWSWATKRLASARNYWIATARPDGYPHMTPVWGVWLDETFYFSTGRRSRKARNLAADPRCVVCPERADEPVSWKAAPSVSPILTCSGKSLMHSAPSTSGSWCRPGTAYVMNMETKGLSSPFAPIQRLDSART